MTAQPHDPTRTGPPVPTVSDGGVAFSLSEIQAECLKAARGRGLPWGLSEEAGMAAAWLAAAGLPGPELILRLLEEPMGGPPAVTAGTWRPASERTLCPIRAGSALSDFCALPAGLGERGLTMIDVALPLLILPFAAQAARRMGRQIDVAWPGFTASVTAEGYRISSPVHGSDGAGQATVTLNARDRADSLPRLAKDGRPVPLDVWRRLDRLAMLTTVPATTRSRADAGAAASDND